MSVPALVTAAPLQPGADEARRAAERELARQVYQDARPGLVQRLWQGLLDLLDRVPEPSGGPLVQTLVVVLLVLGLLVLAALLVHRTGLASRRAEAVTATGLTGPATAAGLRAAARRAADGGRFDDAVVEGFRALVRGLQERDLVASAPGLTAAEAVAAARRGLPDLSGRLTAAGRLFDGVLYGGQRATGEDAAEVAALDAEAARTRPAGVPAA